MEILFRTIHGSHLYGLATADSDLDYYTVIPRVKQSRAKYAKHSIRDGLDSMTVDFSTWLRYCDTGVPQALEAMFSQVPEVDLLTDFRASYRIDTASVVGTYKRTILNFSRGEKSKQRRHAVRLIFNLNDLLEHGRFNPTMTDSDILLANMIMSWPEDEYFEYVDNYLGRNE